MKLWLDDLRPAPVGFDVHVKTAPEAIRLLNGGGVTEISLDHDLGEGADPGSSPGTGYDVAVWIEEQAFTGKLKPPKWAVHSANPVGRRKMEAALENADKYWAYAEPYIEHESTYGYHQPKDEVRVPLRTMQPSHLTLKRKGTMHPPYIKVKGQTYRLAMDPEVAAANVLDMARSIVASESESTEAVELAESVLGLFEWLSRGGFAPNWEEIKGPF